jgi:hypothetical protein
MAWDLSKLTRNNNPHLKKAWGIYTPQKRKLAVGPQAAPVSPEIPPKPLSKKLSLHHQDEMTQVRLGGFVSTL